ncbi:MAG: thioesterase [Firmicutes bacterium]|nr:thioesterase [Bacillota bacterium]MDD4264459.1 thioesterase [Bacillota bacterium]MDD4694411.1 thioesterase [Bacillota bacterium]
MASNSFFKKNYHVDLIDVDFNNRLKLSALFGYLQDVASLHSESLSMGFCEMTQKYNKTWVLMRARLEISRIPRLNEEISIETWPQTPKKLDVERDFLVRDKNQNIIAKASSIWVVLDLKTRRLSKLDFIAKDFPEIISDRALSNKLGKLSAFGDLKSVYKKVVGYSDIDVNGHLNNTKYVDYIMDCFPIDTHKRYIVKALELNFITEALCGDTIQLLRDISDLDSNLVYIEGTNYETNKEVFRSQIEIEPLNNQSSKLDKN